ncbi:MAG: nucleotidyltransferase family protein [Defluviitaleaceae bacterium]|nr:nucleotidyltransferase family protein [Defluviitaleaceae bacterium]
MKILGIIVEYNPFHNGHLYHLNMAKKITNSDFVVAVMSGNFSQRGTPACLDKYKRTLIALQNGVDVVIELPVLYATSAARYFALASISILNNFMVDYICFGAENSNLEILQNATIESEEFKEIFKKNLSKGFSYQRAYEKTLEISKNDIKLSSNNILAIEYLRALKNTNSHIKPFVLQRNEKYTSATEIKKNILNLEKLEKNVPKETYESIKNTNKNITLDDFTDFFKYKVIQEKENIKKYLDVDEGLENRILNNLDSKKNISSMIEVLKTKRYSHFKLQRMISHIFLNITKEDMKKYEYPPYIRILGFKKNSSFLFKNIKNSPLITNIKNAKKILGKDYNLLEKEIFSTEIYNLASKNHDLFHSDYKTPIILS